MGENSQQGARFKPIVGGRAGYKGVKITFPFFSFPPRFLKLMPELILKTTRGEKKARRECQLSIIQWENKYSLHRRGA